jgi:predicted HAD superfamily phosphohydrolase YqeG
MSTDASNPEPVEGTPQGKPRELGTAKGEFVVPADFGDPLPDSVLGNLEKGFEDLQRRVVFVDVDDTLVRSIGTKRIPIPRVVDRVRRLHQEGASLYLWSSGGAAYAKESAEELGIVDCFVAFLPKPTLIIDDQAVSEWRYCKHELPI